MMKRPVLFGAVVCAAALLLWGGWLVHRAWSDLVTLNVRNMDVREVVRKIEWQTWERILVHKDIEGKVTLNVNAVPLPEVLNIICDQVSSRWNAMYPLYSNSQSLHWFKQALRGEADPAQHGWTNLSARFLPMRGGMFGDVLRNQNNLVTLNCLDKSLEIATLSLARYAQARVVPEDGTQGTIRLVVRQVTMSKAVAKLAAQVRRNWDQLYALQPERGGRPGDFAGDRGGRDFRDGPRERFRPDFAGPPDGLLSTNLADTNALAGDTNALAWAQRRAERREAMQQRMQEVLSTLSPEERKQAEEMRQRFEGMAQLSPEERRARFEAFGNNPEFRRMMEARSVSRLLNTTPEQRVARDRAREEWRQRREQGPQRGPPR